jgi:CubicO group peptidase (beta-lactamase class C family)
VQDIERELDELAASSGFSGAVRVDGEGESLARAYGLADRAHGIANTPETRFATASATKGLTALVVAALVEDGVLAAETTARSLLGDDLPLIDDGVTVAHLLEHRSGIGDYVDEDVETDVSAYLIPVPVHELAETEDYLAVLGGHETKFAPGTAFSYSNGGYVVLALLAERASGVPFRELVRTRVCEPAGMVNTAFLRSDELPGDAALGYLEDGAGRSNVFHLPVRGTGDGGIYSTVADFRSFWLALFEGRILPPERVRELVTLRSKGEHGFDYGRGFWLRGDTVSLVGSDAGVSFRSAHHPGRGVTFTVVSNTSDGAWPLGRRLAELLDL